MSAPARHLVLVGLMGSGKTAVGRRCAGRLGRPFVDTDEVVEALAGAPVAAVFEAEGEEGFRARERAAVSEVCDAPRPSVIACGGGAVLAAENRSALRRHGFVVWLTAPPDVLAGRVGAGEGRPLLAGLAPRGVLERMAVEREDAYRDAAHAVVDTEGRDPDEVAGDVLARFGEVTT